MGRCIDTIFSVLTSSKNILNNVSFLNWEQPISHRHCLETECCIGIGPAILNLACFIVVIVWNSETCTLQSSVSFSREDNYIDTVIVMLILLCLNNICLRGYLQKIYESFTFKGNLESKSFYVIFGMPCCFAPLESFPVITKTTDTCYPWKLKFISTH